MGGLVAAPEVERESVEDGGGAEVRRTSRLGSVRSLLCGEVCVACGQHRPETMWNFLVSSG